jgi:GNAT superfamily N-acetyltransferase
MNDITIRSIEGRDLEAANRICNLAFGTFLNVPDPTRFFGDMDYFRSRVGAPNTAGFVAERGGELVGSNLLVRWGSVAFFGPLSVRPDLWDAGVGKQLLAPTLDKFRAWGVTHSGLFTFPQSAKHVGLYYKHGFHPRFLTPVMGKRVAPDAKAGGWTTWSAVPASQRTATIASARRLTGTLYPGLDVSDEFGAVESRGLGDTVLLGAPEKLEGLAVCHVGPGTEAGSGVCYVKFAAAFSGPGAAARFGRLLDAIEAFAASRGAEFISAGVNTEREEAYKAMLERGFRTRMQGVIMHAKNIAGYSRPGVFALDDWR